MVVGELYVLGATLVKAITGEAPPKANDRAFDDPLTPLADLPVLSERFSQSRCDLRRVEVEKARSIRARVQPLTA